MGHHARWTHLVSRHCHLPATGLVQGAQPVRASVSLSETVGALTTLGCVCLRPTQPQAHLPSQLPASWALQNPHGVEACPGEQAHPAGGECASGLLAWELPSVLPPVCGDTAAPEGRGCLCPRELGVGRGQWPSPLLPAQGGTHGLHGVPSPLHTLRLSL